MVAAVYTRKHLTVIPGGLRCERPQRTRRYDRTTRTAYNSHGERVYLPVIGPDDAA